MTGGSAHSPASRSKRRLWAVLVLTASYAGAEAIGGVVTGSLALLADAAYMLTDAALALVCAASAVTATFGVAPVTLQTEVQPCADAAAASVNGR